MKITTTDYYKLHKDYRGTWTTERTDLPNWEKDREKYMGKRTILTNENGATVLLIEGMGLEIIKDDYYTKEFVCGQSSITRGELESFPCPFCTDDATDDMMQRIIDETEAETKCRMRKIHREECSSDDEYKEIRDSIWWKELEGLVVAAGIPYYEDLK